MTFKRIVITGHNSNNGAFTEDDTYKLHELAKRINHGSLVAFPSETVYGLGADGLNEQAVNEIYKVKERPASDPCILHVLDVDMAYSLLDLTEREAHVFKALTAAFWPGPLSIVAKAKPVVPSVTMGGGRMVAVRQSKSSSLAKLIEFSKTPIAGPSANKFGRISPTTVDHVSKFFCNDDVHVIDDGTQSEIGIESSVIKIWETKVASSGSAENVLFDGNGSVFIEILRPGYVTIEMIRNAFEARDALVSCTEGKRSLFSLMNNAPSAKRSRYSISYSPIMDGPLLFNIMLFNSARDVSSFLNEGVGKVEVNKNLVPVEDEIETSRQHHNTNDEAVCPGSAVTHYAPIVPCILVQMQVVTEEDIANTTALVKDMGLPLVSDTVIINMTNPSFSSHINCLQLISPQNTSIEGVMNECFSLLHTAEELAVRLGAIAILILVPNDINDDNHLSLATYDRLMRAASAKLCNIMVSKDNQVLGLLNKDK